MIPYGRQDITQADIDAVVEVLRSDFLTQGPVVPVFEKAVASYCGATYAIAVNSATSALHIACLALGVGKGDEVWTSPITFVASANCALFCGAKVDFVDIDPRTYNMSVDCLAAKLSLAKKVGKLPKVVIPVHFSGQPCDMAGIQALSRQYDFKIIEDASHAIGGKYAPRSNAAFSINEATQQFSSSIQIGNTCYSDITVFSFHPVKIITTAEGGIALTNNAELADRMSLLRSHGITRDPMRMTHESDGPWYYQQVNLGFNYRMTEVHAALGVSQINRLDEYVARRHQLARRYNELLAELPVTTPWQHTDSYSAFHLYVIVLHLDTIRRTHRKVFDSLLVQGIGVNLHYIPVHMHPYYQRMGFKQGDFPEAESYYASAISLPMYPTMSEVQQDAVIFALRKAIQV